MTKQKLNITLVDTWRLINAKGGMEKVFCNMANALVERGHNVTAICYETTDGKPGYPLDNRVSFINAGLLKTPLHLSKFFSKLRAFDLKHEERKRKREEFFYDLQQYKITKALSGIPTDVVVTYQIQSTYVSQKIFGNSVPIITMLHGNPGCYFTPNLLQSVKSAAEVSTVVQVLRPEFVDELLDILPSANVEVIPNCVPQFNDSADLYTNKIICVGRIAQEKQHILLAEAFAFIKDKFPTWDVEIWGEENYEPTYTEKLRSVISKYKLENRFHLCGTTDNIPQKLKKASIFAFPSKLEGFPLALTEAMSMGLPSVGCKNCPAVNTLIRDDHNGLLCNDTPESIAEALSTLMQDEQLRIRLGRCAKEDMKEYAPEKIWDQWENLLLSLAEK